MNINFLRLLDAITILSGFIVTVYGLWTQDIKTALIGFGLAYFAVKSSN